MGRIEKFLIGVCMGCALAAGAAGQSTAAEEPLRSLQARAGAGDAKAQNELGTRYATGDGVEKDAQQALTWYGRAAKQGYATAYFNIGTAFYNGEGMGVDEEQACAWFLLAAEGGDASGKAAYERERQELSMRPPGSHCEILAGDKYLHGDFVPKDAQHAFALYKLAADAGDAAAGLRLYGLYKEGRGVEKDPAAAQHWLEFAVDHGNITGAYFLGHIYDVGDGVPVDAHKACEFYSRAVNGGEVRALVPLGNLLRDGRGVKANPEMAFRLYYRAANRGDANGTAAVNQFSSSFSGKKLDELVNEERNRLQVVRNWCK